MISLLNKSLSAFITSECGKTVLYVGDVWTYPQNTHSWIVNDIENGIVTYSLIAENGIQSITSRAEIIYGLNRRDMIKVR